MIPQGDSKPGAGGGRGVGGKGTGSAGQGAPQRVPPAAPTPGKQSGAGGSTRARRSLRPARRASPAAAGLGSRREVKRARPGWAEARVGRGQQAPRARARARAGAQMRSQAGGRECSSGRLAGGFSRLLLAAWGFHPEPSRAAQPHLGQSRPRAQAGKPHMAGCRACRQQAEPASGTWGSNRCLRQAGIPLAGLLPPLPQA